MSTSKAAAKAISFVVVGYARCITTKSPPLSRGGRSRQPDSNRRFAARPWRLGLILERWNILCGH